jgi:hypothetical protein
MYLVQKMLLPKREKDNSSAAASVDDVFFYYYIKLIFQFYVIILDISRKCISQIFCWVETKENGNEY